MSECQVNITDDGEICGRKVIGRGWCSSHYRRWRSGEDMDAPIRGYSQREEDADGNCKPVSTKTDRPRREKPFATEC